MCRNKEKEMKDRELEEIKGLRYEIEVWKYLNRVRTRKEKIEYNIGKEE